ncbi:hypothetical protein, partial [Burkholderia pseudomallei]|uniref:hypothetical protein n=1 Tax=Burkholderia pseudomallei TaxID=28450 RepID=UPI001E3F502A
VTLLYDESYRFFLEFLGKRTPDHGLALQTTRYLLFEPSKGIEPLHSPHSAHLPSPRRARFPLRLSRDPQLFRLTLAHRFGAETLAQRLRFTVSKSERHWVPTHTFRREGRSAPLGAIIGMSSMLASP